jgi:hypothetical protein
MNPLALPGATPQMFSYLSIPRRYNNLDIPALFHSTAPCRIVQPHTLQIDSTAMFLNYIAGRGVYWCWKTPRATPRIAYSQPTRGAPALHTTFRDESYKGLRDERGICRWVRNA